MCRQLSHKMNRQGSQYSTSYHYPMIGSTSYNRPARSIPTTTNGNATSIIKSINSGHMNISTTNNRTRAPSRFSQTSPERSVRVTTQRRQPSQDRSVSFY